MLPDFGPRILSGDNDFSLTEALRGLAILARVKLALFESTALPTPKSRTRLNPATTVIIQPNATRIDPDELRDILDTACEFPYLDDIHIGE